MATEGHSRSDHSTPPDLPNHRLHLYWQTCSRSLILVESLSDRDLLIGLRQLTQQADTASAFCVGQRRQGKEYHNRVYCCSLITTTLKAATDAEALMLVW